MRVEKWPGLHCWHMRIVPMNFCLLHFLLTLKHTSATSSQFLATGLQSYTGSVVAFRNIFGYGYAGLLQHG